jgi:hypothetical protein
MIFYPTNWPHASEAGSLNKSSCLAPALGVSKFIIITNMIMVTIVVLLKSDLDAQQTHLRGQFVEKRLVLSSSFRCNQINYCERYDFDHTLLCYLSPT